MTAKSEHDAAVTGVLLLIACLFLLLAAPAGILLGANALEMAVVAIAGVGFAVLHLAVVLALHLRALERRP